MALLITLFYREGGSLLKPSAHGNTRLRRERTSGDKHHQMENVRVRKDGVEDVIQPGGVPYPSQSLGLVILGNEEKSRGNLYTAEAQ